MSNKKIKLVLVYHQMKVQGNVPHFGLLSLGAYVKQKFSFVEVKILDNPNPLRQILKYKPDIIGFTGASTEYKEAISLAKNVKKHSKALLLIGGIHISTCPQSFNNIFDIGVIGEGELTLGEILDLYKDKKINHNNLKKINGLVFFNKNKLIITKPRQLIKNIDDLPIPARELIPMENYLKNQINFYGIKRQMIITTSRGCPYHCVYCSSSAHWGSFRFHSVEYIINEIDHLIKTYKVDGIVFWDDLFIAPKSRLLLLVKEIKKRGWDKTIVFSGQARSNIADEDVIKALKSINTTRLSFGFETYSPKMLNYLKVNSVFVKDNIRTVKLCNKYDIDVTSGLIVGSPGETIKDLKITYNTMKKYPLDLTNIYLLAPYPGTKIWEYSKNNNIVSDDMDMNRVFTEIPLKTCFQFWKKDRFYFLKNHVFLNQEKRHDQQYLSMILKIKRLAFYQNNKYYFKYFKKNPQIIFRIIKQKWNQKFLTN